MKLKFYLLTIFLFFSYFGYNQNMQEGFNYLENGNYKAAENYFETVLKEHPDNKTAKLCYGRAVGLNGEASKAVDIFTSLLETYPNDFEIKLNYAESLLWDKRYTEAKTYYERLVTENDQSFPALLGYANTLSNLKIYKKALEFVNNSLVVSPGNPNALISKKYIQLGYANQYVQEQKYEDALSLLKDNLLIFKGDKETLLNLANVYIISNDLNKAEDTYKKIATSKKDSAVSLNGLSLVSHLKFKEKDALSISKSAMILVKDVKDSTIVDQTKERYIQALIWNNKYKEAKSLIDELMASRPSVNWILSLRATLNIYKSDFKKSIDDYNRILEIDSASFDGNLGKANALKASGLYEKAYLSANNTLKFYDNQKDAVNFIKTLNTGFTPFLETKGSFSFDNGNNEAFSFQSNTEMPLSIKLKILANYNYRTTNNTVTGNEASSNSFLIGLSYQLLPNITFKGTAGITSAKANTNDYTQLLTDISFNIKPYKLQVLDIGYKREIQNFNADLLDREIVQNHFYANYNISSNVNLGWFTQYYFTSQNDNNNRHLLFTSLYYNILKKPSLKAGLNYQYITFKDQVPTIYFSPEKFNATEVFMNLMKDELITKPKEWFYELTAATGIQFIESDKAQSTYRFQGRLGYKFSDRCLANMYGTHSNIASATAAGFTYSEIGVRFKWYLSDKPIFKK